MQEPQSVTQLSRATAAVSTSYVENICATGGAGQDPYHLACAWDLLCHEQLQQHWTSALPLSHQELPIFLIGSGGDQTNKPQGLHPSYLIMYPE